MLLIFAYVIIGFVFGCFVVYKMLDVWGWDDLLEDFNKRLKGKHTELNVFKISFPIFTVSAITFTWPYFIYLFVNKKYFK